MHRTGKRRGENHCGSFFLSSLNEEELSRKTAANAAPRLWPPPRLTILPQLPALCRVLKSSSTCWLLLLLNGAVLSKLENSFRPRLLSYLPASWWEWITKANHIDRGGYSSKTNQKGHSLEISTVKIKNILLHTSVIILHWKFRFPSAHVNTFNLTGVAKCLMLNV